MLTGGASSTYGADAVGGVVNFITRSDFAGVELSASEQITERGDGNIFRADLTIGANFDDGRGNAVISIGYQEADPVYFGGDRPFSEVTLESFDEFFVAGQGSSTTTPSRFDIGGGRGPQQVSPDGLGHPAISIEASTSTRTTSSRCRLSATTCTAPAIMT